MEATTVITLQAFIHECNLHLSRNDSEVHEAYMT